MLSNYQFDKYLSVGTDENGDEKLKLPLEQIFLAAGAEFQQVRRAARPGRRIAGVACSRCGACAFD